MFFSVRECSSDGTTELKNVPRYYFFKIALYYDDDWKRNSILLFSLLLYLFFSFLLTFDEKVYSRNVQNKDEGYEWSKSLEKVKRR